MTRFQRNASFFAPAIGLFTLFSATSALSADVKEPEVHFYPAKTWNVSSAPVDVAGATVQRCTITNEFNNGFIVQLTGSHRWVEALQIDFRQDAFDPGQTYDVALTVPGINNKTLSGQAASPSQMVIGLKGQKDFYQTIRDSSVFDLKIDDNEFRFYMVGFDQKAQGFERCMAGGDAQAPTTKAESDAMPTYNEAIAYEQAEKTGVPITEILPSAPRPSVSAAVQAEAEEIAEITPVKPQFGIQNGPDRKRLSETLAEEIQRNPDIASADIDKPVERSIEEMQKDASVAPPPAPMPSPVVEAEPEYVMPADPAEFVMSEDEVPVEKRGLAMPEDLNEEPELPAPPGLEEIAEAKAAERAERIRAAAQAQLNAERKIEEPVEEVAAADVAEVAEEKPFEPIVPNTYERAEMIVDTTTLTEPEAFTPEPVTAVESVPVVQARAPVEPPAPVTIEEPVAATTPAPEVLLEQPEKSAMPKTPDMKVTKQTGQLEVDLTEQYAALDAVEPASAPPVTRQSDSELARRIAMLEKELSAAKQENNALNDELKDALQESRDEQLSISSENWNLEKVTRQYDEAERQLKRLGQQLQQERTACSVEKRELEAMLFDPSVTEDAQIAKLTRLQRELDETKAQLRALQGTP